jgi:hypothetical protein
VVKKTRDLGAPDFRSSWSDCLLSPCSMPIALNRFNLAKP